MPRANTEERIRKITEKRARLSAEMQRLKGREQQAERKRDTRRKILIGARILAADDWSTERIKKLMDGYVQKEQDRELFGLPPRPAD